MPSVIRALTLGAGATQDVMTDTEYEYPPSARGNVITVAGTTVVAGSTMTVTLGQRNVLEGAPLTLVGAGVNPVIPDNILVRDVARPGERIRVRITDGGAGGVSTALVDIG